MEQPRRKPRSKDGGDVYVGNYKLVEEIGKGSFALVYLGEHPKSKTFVAVKAVSLRRLSKKLRDNLKSEIEILKGLHHPHITAMIDCQETSSYIHVIMEFCALGDLSLFIKKRHHLDSNFMALEMVQKYPTPAVGGINGVVVHHFLKQLSSALEFLRSKDLIHRDLKPQNLLLNPPPKALAEGNVKNPPYKIAENSLTPAVGVPAFPMLKIADFGFARSLPSTSLAETLCGSPLYMAPEILRYEKYDAKADLWSVGTVLYEMLVGRPPFRAANHVELLRKIERSDDKIRFPEEVEVSKDMKEIIRALLKRNPVERINFKDFFASSVITGDIPGLDPADAEFPLKKEEVKEDKRASLSGLDHVIPEQPYSSSPTKDASSTRRLTSSRPTTPVSKGSYKSLRKPSVDNTATDLQRAAVMGRQVSALSRGLPSGASGNRDDTSGAMMRHGSKDKDSPHASLLQEKLVSRDRGPERSKTVGNVRIAAASDAEKERERERAAQEVAFERDYVVVTKRQVEVNLFADELAASPRLQQKQASPRNAGAIVRRATTSNAHQTKARLTNQNAQNSPNPTTKRRTGSFDLRSGPAATTSAISKALNMASNRLLGVSFSPPTLGFAKGPSPPLAYSPFPHYPQVQGSLVLVGDGRKDQLVALDEDSKTAQILEDCATRSDVVYGFAEVKYKQLIPLAPSAQPDTIIRPGGISPGAGGDIDDVGTDDLPAEAVVTLSEEGLVLYVKSLSLLAKTMNIAGAWWARKNRGEVTGESPPAKTEGYSFAVLTRINAVVQWTRTRFNEVLQKAEYVRARLSESQKRLPEDHPSHPSNNTGAPVTGIEYGSTEHIYLSPGVTAERLIFERAVEMSKTAAINEISNTDLPGCDLSYVTAIRMLEAVLESDDEDEAKSSKSKKGGDEGTEKRDNVNVLSEHEQKEVAAVIERIRQRLVGVRTKMEHIEMMAKRASSVTPTGNGRSTSPAAFK